MENFKGTKGEWKYDINANNGFDIYCDNSLKVIATALFHKVSYMPNETEAEANAKLIAASKDLLEACIKASEFIKTDYLTNAINKATL